MPKIATSGDQSVPSRDRLNLTLEPRVRRTVALLAEMLGMSDSQLVVHALVMSLPELHKQVGVVLQCEQMKGHIPGGLK